MRSDVEFLGLQGREDRPGHFTFTVAEHLARALDVVAGGTSLDNTVRVGSVRETEWVLLDIRPHFVAGSYGHGVVHVWSEDGHLMVTASQTASMFPFDLENPPWKAKPVES